MTIFSTVMKFLRLLSIWMLLSNLGAMFWQKAGDGGSSLLHFFFNLFLKVGCIPTDLKTAVITSIFKKGNTDRSIVDNYRPISVLNTMLKIFEILLLQYISETFGEEILNPFQSGFRRLRSTYDNLIPVDAAIRQANFDGTPLYVAFLDIKKAFDSTWRNGILHLLHEHGISDMFLNILGSLFTNTYSIARTSEGYSQAFQTTAGVRQGSILSPFLFNIHANS